ncbi:polysaccharide ABC transporter ATP-binding protein [Cytophagaceae bacterium YF14B1]|uniref:Polysaccharide ABC transporter ATP-binding protein n=1 Tax=Xanthocytophaga flava TaxID=3048013 RepID=A0AAE3QN37_9BACT|nr:polysaccharide ABC transporter ATP-binding protein [Xanthocytophaga flavus]MDJ1482392.1 polysaccharide ABC transporter ATP-binding protein [Xanthocytophaga flavus]
MSNVAIKVENLSKLYQIGTQKSGSLRDSITNKWDQLRGSKKGSKTQDFWALDDLSFEIRQGEAVGIIGKNGAGKSTLLKVLSRITEPTKGRIEIHGRVASLLEVGTGFHPELSGRENIYLNGTILGMTRKEIKDKFDEIVAFSGVEKFIDTAVKYYSSGMYVRLAFAVAAHLEPEILIIDEVLAVGDLEFQKKCLGKMEEVAGQGRTVLFVSHDMQAISALTSRSIFLRQGKVDFIGPTPDAINYYINQTKAQDLIYIGSPSPVAPKITKVSISTSLPNNVHTNGESLIIEITIDTPHSLQGACLSFHVVDSKERNYAHLWIFDSDQPICREEGTHILKCVIPNCRLYMGRYFLKVYFSEPPGGQIFQVLENICPFEVVMYGKHREFQWYPEACAYIEDGTWEVQHKVIP